MRKVSHQSGIVFFFSEFFSHSAMYVLFDTTVIITIAGISNFFSFLLRVGCIFFSVRLILTSGRMSERVLESL